MSADQPVIQVGTLDQGLYLAVRGRATQRTCPTAELLVNEFLATHGDGSQITIDVTGCDWFDSTFAGWLTRLTKRVARGGGSLSISGCGERCQTSLQRMRLDRLFRFAEHAPPAELRSVPCATTDKPTRAELQLMLEAHEELAGLSESNRRMFQPIVDLLRGQIGQS